MQGLVRHVPCHQRHDSDDPSLALPAAFALRPELGWGAEELSELRQKEKELGVEPDWEIDAFMKASDLKGKQHNVVTDYILRILGLEVALSPSLLASEGIRALNRGVPS